ncbi:hypothetical protein CRUP_037110 [Coryphaenoides rupestris]|nr:hypothetical protein CRUP_037110 [Coryphaenoides rupestris]
MGIAAVMVAAGVGGYGARYEELQSVVLAEFPEADVSGRVGRQSK